MAARNSDHASGTTVQFTRRGGFGRNKSGQDILPGGHESVSGSLHLRRMVSSARLAEVIRTGTDDVKGHRATSHDRSKRSLADYIRTNRNVAGRGKSAISHALRETRRVRLPRPWARSTSTRRALCRELRPPPTPHRPNELARSQAALARRAMIASRVSSLAAESETNAATARCRPSGRVIMPMSLVAEVMPLRVPPVPVLCATTVPAGGRTCFWRSPYRVSAGESRTLQNLPARCLLSRSLKLKRPNVFTFGRC